MSRSDQLRIPDYLDHVLVAIQRIFQYVEDMTEADFLEDEKTQDAVIRNFEVIGEASRNLERYHPDFVARHPEVPWGDAYLLRNQIAHGYFKVAWKLSGGRYTIICPAWKKMCVIFLKIYKSSNF